MKKQFSVSGMTCSACSARVERCVRAVEGVTGCTVNLITGALSVEMNEDVSAEIMSAVVREGYKIKEGVSLKRGREREYALKRRLIISVPLMLVLMYISMGPMIGIPVPPFLNAMEMRYMFPASIVQAAITLAVIIVNFDYFRVGFKKLFGLHPNMDSLVAMGATASFVYGVYTVVQIGIGHFTGDHDLMMKFMDNLYFEGAAMILTLITVGKFLEEKSKNKTMGSVEKLLGLAPDTAVVLVGGEEKEVKIADLKEGDFVVLKDGCHIPCDCVIESGSGWVDQSAITGESVPVYKEKGEKLVTGTVFSGGYAVAKAVSVGEDTTLYKIVRLVEDANSTKVPIAKLADKVAGIFVPAVIAIAVTALVVWLILGETFAFAINIAVSVLVVSCPCALGLATPAALMAGTGKAAEYGILIKSGEALQKTQSITAVVLDKTGTITYGKPKISSVELSDGVSRSEFLKYCASLEKRSSHVLGKPVIELAESENVPVLPVENFETVKGAGIKGKIGGLSLRLGNLGFVLEVCPGGKDSEIAKRSQKEVGATVLYLAIDSQIAGYMSINDEIKPSSKQAVKELKAMGKRVVMLTGDNESAAKKVADELDVEYEAGVLPDTKYETVVRLEKEGYKVMMVGDGVNDAPALTAASVGAAIGAGTDIAIDSADVVLIKNDLTDVVKCLKLGSKVMLNVKENLFWAFFYNAILIPIACGVFVFAGVTLNPSFASLAMSLSSVCVVCNALRLRLIKFKDESADDKTTTAEHRIKESQIKEARVKAELQTNTAKGDNMKEIKAIIYIDGMMCEHCKKRVEAVLKDLGLTGEVDLGGKRALVYDGNMDENAVKTAIEDAGYEFVRIEKK
ncbi:MAG: heavy metal translocating P-type ATPase [Candidatus Borkfalkiaceae bacterium]|nr:heavy metal translocating P-type ATPase [Christensenellaceae bacterium]